MPRYSRWPDDKSKGCFDNIKRNVIKELLFGKYGIEASGTHQ